ncbi:MAG: ScyD/ScyE family protein, partial [Actinomycetota bacterium]
LVLVAVMALTLMALAPAAATDQSYEFPGPNAFDIAAAPGGSVLVAQGSTVHEIRKGTTALVAEIEAMGPINGLATLGRGDFLATTQSPDRAVEGKLWRVSRGGVRSVADLGAFERAADPDAFEGPGWKDQRCEEVDGFSVGPQTNPFHLEALSGGSALVADAAGNTLLSATTAGRVDWAALFTPPVDANGDWLVRFHQDTSDGPIPCYVQPVPTSVAIAPDGDYYVGTLTGSTADPGANLHDPADDIPGVDARGLSAVWRVDSGARHAVCSEDGSGPGCTKAIAGLTSVIDVAFGPDGSLYVLEYDANGWWAAFGPGGPAGSRLLRCDPAVDQHRDHCDVVAGESELLLFAGAITFDKSGDLWILEGNVLPVPVVRSLHLP